jgi:L-threonylcarbamoyladenylate synthase
MSATAVGTAVAAVRAGSVVVIPTDTVYGLAVTPDTVAARDALYRLKGRDASQATALVGASLEHLLERVPELGGRAERIAAALLPGPYTLVLPNPARRFAWLCGVDPTGIGLRVPELRGPGREVLERVGVVAATSANLPGGPEPRTLAEVPEQLRAGAAALVDAGELPGTASTVLDFTGVEARVLRKGAGDVALALSRVAAIA